MPTMFNGTKEEFEKLTKCEPQLPDWLERLKKEYDFELDKVYKLDKWMETEEFKKTSELNQMLTERQARPQREYVKALGFRLDAEKIPHKKYVEGWMLYQRLLHKVENSLEDDLACVGVENIKEKGDK